MDREPANSGDALASGAYDRMYGEWVERGVSPIDAASLVAEAYLDGRPASRGKHKITGAMRDAAFWKGAWLTELPAQALRCEPMELALVRYLRQEGISNPDLIARIASHAPDTLQLAVRRSEIVLKQDSERWQEVKVIAGRMQEVFGDLLTVFEVFGRAYRERVDLVQQCRKPLTRLSPLMLDEATLSLLPGIPIPAHAVLDRLPNKPTFVGHYWLTDKPQMLSANVACVDYSVARGGKLVAYRWDGEAELSESKFFWLER